MPVRSNVTRSVADRDPRRDPDRLVAHAVVVQVVGRLDRAAAAGRAMRRDRAPARVGEQVVDAAFDGLGSPRSSISSPSRRRPTVTLASWARRSPSVSRGERTLASEHRQHAGVDHAVVHDPDRRDDQALLDLLAVEADAPRRPAADVDVMGHRDRVRERPAVDDQRRDEADVVEVEPAEVAVVAQDRVAGLERRAVPRQDARARSGPASRGGSAGRTTARPIRACPSSSAHEKSSRVLMLVEYAARRRVTLISSVIPVSAWRKISRRSASVAGRWRSWPSSVAVMPRRLAARGRRAGR